MEVVGDKQLRVLSANVQKADGVYGSLGGSPGRRLGWESFRPRLGGPNSRHKRQGDKHGEWERRNGVRDVFSRLTQRINGEEF